MNRRDWMRSGLIAPGIAALGPIGGRAADDPPPSKARRRGVTLAGAEFGVREDFSNESPGVFGRDYTYFGEKTVEYFVSRGIRDFRIPFRWERIQPKLNEPLDGAELGRLTEAVARIKKAGGSAILDPHNFARYRTVIGGKPTDVVIDEKVGDAVPVPRERFADLWRRLAEAFSGEPAVRAFALMNETHDLKGSDWKGISQAAVDAIRRSGDRRAVIVPGESWSSARRFLESNGPTAWIKDPADNVFYEAHSYWDSDESGTYKLSYDEELRRDKSLENRGVRHLMAFAGWCAVNGVRGFVGEFGVPNDDPRWLAVMARFLEGLDRTGMEGCYWAAGEWWGKDRLSIQPRDGFRTDAVQLGVLTGVKGRA